MSHHKPFIVCIVWVLVLLSRNMDSYSWPFSWGSSSENPSDGIVVAEFSMESSNSKEGVMLVEKAKRKAALSNSCWQNAYQNLFAGCSEILAGEEQRARLAWHLSDCFQKETGRPRFPYCDVKSLMVNCLKKLDEDAHRIYLEFYLQTSVICHQLQSDAFKRQTERLVNELKRSAEYAEDKLDKIENQAERVLHSSDHIQNSLSSIDVRTQQLAQTSKNVEESINVVLEQSHSIYEKSLKITDSQMELQNGQMNMNVKLGEGMTMLNESANKLGEEMSNLRNEAVEIEKELDKVGGAMFTKMDTLQSKADDIESIAETSLDQQKQLVESQRQFLEVLRNVTSFQSQALEESRGTLQQLILLGHNQQQELIQRQEQLKQAHDQLVENSKNILAAQETFESKQASMFLAIEKLFNLHNAIFLESRVVKAFLVYSMLIFILYMFTSTKQTYSMRPRLNICKLILFVLNVFFGMFFILQYPFGAGLCVTFLIEFMVLRYGNNIEQQSWIISIVRLTFVILASGQLLYAIFTYRDYETLNHLMLESLIEKVNGIMQGNKQLLYDDDSDVDWSSWVDSDLPEDEPEDPDYMLCEDVMVASNCASSSREYNLRHRRRQ
ncbi:hypothetical protein SSX86_012311 [Deinandra increscens subsp. villosa]|uniref:Protein GAMETE EXPRESSED 1 n=1 Tax=Deinandra increscens subsp. villosa TaxID=3103831 RepID=A0AAP0D3Z7_9ASTR